MTFNHHPHFSNWIIYVTVKQAEGHWRSCDNFSNWIIYVTVKPSMATGHDAVDFSNWIIYVTVKLVSAKQGDKAILVTE